MSSLVSKAQDVSCVTGISIQYVIITDLFMNVKSESRLDIHEQVIYYML
jgi:hypothetical protein